MGAQTFLLFFDTLQVDKAYPIYHLEDLHIPLRMMACVEV